jgi:hypothetical protein
MIYTGFDQVGRSVCIMEASRDTMFNPNLIFLEGDHSNYYKEDGLLIEKTEFIFSEVIDNKLDFGLRINGDTMVVNGVAYDVVGPTIIEFSEPGEYEITISFVKHFEKTEVITCT